MMSFLRTTLLAVVVTFIGGATMVQGTTWHDANMRVAISDDMLTPATNTQTLALFPGRFVHDLNPVIVTASTQR